MLRPPNKSATFDPGAPVCHAPDVFVGQARMLRPPSHSATFDPGAPVCNPSDRPTHDSLSDPSLLCAAACWLSALAAPVGPAGLRVSAGFQLALVFLLTMAAPGADSNPWAGIEAGGGASGPDAAAATPRPWDANAGRGVHHLSVGDGDHLQYLVRMPWKAKSDWKDGTIFSDPETVPEEPYKTTVEFLQNLRGYAKDVIECPELLVDQNGNDKWDLYDQPLEKYEYLGGRSKEAYCHMHGWFEVLTNDLG